MTKVIFFILFTFSSHSNFDENQHDLLTLMRHFEGKSQFFNCNLEIDILEVSTNKHIRFYAYDTYSKNEITLQFYLSCTENQKIEGTNQHKYTFQEEIKSDDMHTLSTLQIIKDFQNTPYYLLASIFNYKTKKREKVVICRPSI